MLYADADRLGTLSGAWLSGTRRLAPLSLRPVDFPRSGRRVDADPRGAVNERLARHGFAAADRAFLLAQPRSWGWLFNPVSFYFCFRDGTLANVVAEITNTPWDEVHCYVLDARRQPGERLEFAFPKRFHVSPFMPMDMDYRWRMKLSEDGIEIAMSLVREGQEVFFAGLYLNVEPISTRTLRRGALAYPLQNLRTLTRIYWQAFRLWRRGAPFHPHPGTVTEVRST